jgi:phosphoribosyl 1,2-cyclic phosphodiesterase
MRLQVLSSGSQGNATLVQADEVRLLVDAGLSGDEMQRRLSLARVPEDGLHHVAVTHGHLDHARSAGLLSRRRRALLHCAEAVQRNASIRRAKQLATLSPARPSVLAAGPGRGALELRAVPLPHDADPTYAFRLEAEGRCAVILTDMGRPDEPVARALAGAHLLVLEFNHDLERLRSGPYPAALKRRITGHGGHLSNEQAAAMLEWLVGPQLHTLVLAHLSEANNHPDLARAAAAEVLTRLGRSDVRVLVASQYEPGPVLEV